MIKYVKTLLSLILYIVIIKTMSSILISTSLNLKKNSLMSKICLSMSLINSSSNINFQITFVHLLLNLFLLLEFFYDILHTLLSKNYVPSERILNAITIFRSIISKCSSELNIHIPLVKCYADVIVFLDYCLSHFIRSIPDPINPLKHSFQ